VTRVDVVVHGLLLAAGLVTGIGLAGWRDRRRVTDRVAPPEYRAEQRGRLRYSSYVDSPYRRGPGRPGGPIAPLSPGPLDGDPRFAGEHGPEFPAGRLPAGWVTMPDGKRIPIGRNPDADPCDRAPAGWWCSRTPGHDGPCAARPDPGTYPIRSTAHTELDEPAPDDAEPGLR
jgi:hypothetical protein